MHCSNPIPKRVLCDFLQRHAVYCKQRRVTVDEFRYFQDVFKFLINSNQIIFSLSLEWDVHIYIGCILGEEKCIKNCSLKYRREESTWDKLGLDGV